MSEASVARKGHRTSGTRRAARKEHFERDLHSIAGELEQVLVALRTLLGDMSEGETGDVGRDWLIFYSKWHLCDQLERITGAIYRAHAAQQKQETAA